MAGVADGRCEKLLEFLKKLIECLFHATLKGLLLILGLRQELVLIFEQDLVEDDGLSLGLVVEVQGVPGDKVASTTSDYVLITYLSV